MHPFETTLEYRSQHPESKTAATHTLIVIDVAHNKSEQPPNQRHLETLTSRNNSRPSTGRSQMSASRADFSEDGKSVRKQGWEPPFKQIRTSSPEERNSGGGRIRTYVAYALGLQPSPFNHSGTPPHQVQIVALAVLPEMPQPFTMQKVAELAVGVEPTTTRLQGGSSTAELR